MSQDWKMGRATVSFSGANDSSVPSDSLIAAKGDLFDVNVLTKHGR